MIVRYASSLQFKTLGEAVIKPKAKARGTQRVTPVKFLQIHQHGTTGHRDNRTSDTTKTVLRPILPAPPLPAGRPAPAKQTTRERIPLSYLGLLNIVRLNPPEESKKFMKKRKELLDGGYGREAKKKRRN